MICRSDIEALKDDGVLTDLVLCESEAPTETLNRPKYIYDALRAQPDDVCLPHFDVFLMKSNTYAF